MRKIDLEELKVIQMDVLEVIHKFCNEHNIKYSLACGTMLGAIRHKGYIPWDDDIDIYMLRDEYDKLIRLFPKEQEHIHLASLERDKDWDRGYAQAYNVRTEMHEGEERDLNHKMTIGVGIDIYPIDEVPSNEAEWCSWNQKRLWLQWALILKYSVWRPGRDFKKNIGLVIAKIGLLPFSQRFIAELIDKYGRKYNGRHTGYVFETMQGIFQKHPFKKETLEEVIDTPFEGKIFKGMKNYDDYLSNGYGNYMKLPPKEKRVNHHFFRAWWKE